MSTTLTFMMGKFAAAIPKNRSYAKNHMWAQDRGSEVRFGFTAYAVRLLQDVYFLDWEIESGALLQERQEIGQIESSKAESSLYSPAAGRLVELNEALLDDPTPVNTDKYEAGWLFDIATNGTQFLSAEEYVEHLGAVWEVTQRTIKGQLNE